MVARVATTSKWERGNKGAYTCQGAQRTTTALCPTLSASATSSTPPPPTLDWEAQGTVTPVKSDSQASRASTPLTSLSPMDPIPSPSPPVLTPHSPFSHEHLPSLHKDPSSPQALPALQMPLRGVQDPVYYDQNSQI
jgi:hypothetical protein